MIKQFSLIFFICISFTAFGQLKPLILKGKLENCAEKEIYISLLTPAGESILDTINIKADGSFYYKTFKCKTPQKVSMQRTSTQINDIFVAPGYDLTITADAKDPKTLFTTTVITGLGAGVNQYRQKLTDYHKTERPEFYNMDSTQLIPELNKLEKAYTSILNDVFDTCKEPYAAFFKRMEVLNNTYIRYYRILDHANYSRYDYNTYIQFIRKNIPENILNNPGNDEYLNISRDYKSWFISAYNDYLREKTNRRDSTIIKKDKEYVLKQIASVYKGKVREYVFNRKYASAIEFSKSIDELTAYKKSYMPFLTSYVSASKTKALQTTFNKRYAFFLNTKVGMLATNFTLPDTIGSNHSLSDFIGKVVYIDFWASWCGPCRAEIPALKELYKKYEKEPRLKVVSVAVFDGKVDWIRALKQDQPSWLQLRDGNGKASTSYKTNTIPRYAIIDKKGKIVSIDAPEPSNKALIKILETEMTK